MSISDELGRLGELHQRGVLSDDEFMRAKARVLSGAAATGQPAVIAAVNGLRRSREDAWLGGVCAGIARATGTATWVWRLIFTLLLLCAGSGVLAYLLMWILVPQEAAPLANAPAPLRAG